MNQEKAQKQLDAKLAKIMSLLEECEQIAEDSQLEFRFRPAYGMGGWYNPHPDGKRYKGDPGTENNTYGWYSSTRSCSGW